MSVTSLSVLCFVWGAVAACMAAVKSWQALSGVRFALGIAEAGFAPGITFYLSSWYKRHELAKRYSIYYTATAVSVRNFTTFSIFRRPNEFHRVLSLVSWLVSSRIIYIMLVALTDGDGFSSSRVLDPALPVSFVTCLNLVTRV